MRKRSARLHAEAVHTAQGRQLTREWNHNIAYHDFVLGAVPAGRGRALDVGCGGGLLTRQLAGRCKSVVGIDLDASDVRSDGVSLLVGDVMTYPFDVGSFDFIAAVATLHHLPLESGLRRFRELLAPGGVLAVVGLYRTASLGDHMLAAAALPVSWTLRASRGYSNAAARWRPPAETLSEIRDAATSILPGAVLRRRLLFRYTLVWHKPSARGERAALSYS